MSRLVDVMPLKVKKRRDVKLKSLHYQFIPMVTPIKLWDYNMSLAKSPHVELMRILLAHGMDWSKIGESRYVKERTRRHDLGLKQWTTAKIKEHIKRRYAILKSLKRAGYRHALYKDKPIVVLEKPFWMTRFGYKEKWLRGIEIWDGGGRCAAAMALDWETIDVEYYWDIYAGTSRKGKFESKLENVNGVWNATFGVNSNTVL